MFNSLRTVFYKDSAEVAILMCFVVTLILGFPYALFGNGTLPGFIIFVAIPVIGLAFYRERVLSVQNLRDYNLMNILQGSWLPILIIIFAALS